MRNHKYSWTFGYDGKTWFRDDEEINDRQNLPSSKPNGIYLPDGPLHPSGQRLLKIAHLRAAIAAGSYSVSAEKLVDKMQFARSISDLCNP